jgi:hypothetical protein
MAMNRRTLFSIPIVAAWLARHLTALADAKPSRLPVLNEKVVAFARARKGVKVGDGVCLTLAVEALRSSGAKTCLFNEPDANYVWGTLVESPHDALPGDVVQFRDAEFKGKRQLSRKRTISWHQTYPHHTAIVSEVAAGGKLITILHQNVGGSGAKDDARKVVQETTLRMDSLQKGGSVWIYRPVADSPDPTPAEQPGPESN